MVEILGAKGKEIRPTREMESGAPTETGVDPVVGYCKGSTVDVVVGTGGEG